MIRTYEYENLKKHSVTVHEIIEVLSSSLTNQVKTVPSKRGNDRVILVGWTYQYRILEIGIEYFDDEDREHIYHAMDATVHHKNGFLQRLGPLDW